MNHRTAIGFVIAIVLGASTAAGQETANGRLTATVTVNRQASCYDGPEGFAETLYVTLTLTNVSGDNLTLVPRSSYWSRTTASTRGEKGELVRVWEIVPDLIGIAPDPRPPLRWPTVVLQADESLRLPHAVSVLVWRGPGPTPPGLVGPGDYYVEVEHVITEEREGGTVQIVSRVSPDLLMRIRQPFSFEYCSETYPDVFLSGPTSERQ